MQVVSLREEGVDLSLNKKLSEKCHDVSLREEGVDLSCQIDPCLQEGEVSLREEGVDLSIVRLYSRISSLGLPPRGGSGFKRAEERPAGHRKVSPSARREWI